MNIDTLLLHKKKYDIVLDNLLKIFKRYNLHNPQWTIFEHIKYVKKIKLNNYLFKKRKFKYWNNIYSYYFI